MQDPAPASPHYFLHFWRSDPLSLRSWYDAEIMWLFQWGSQQPLLLQNHSRGSDCQAEGTRVLHAKPCRIAFLGIQALPGTGLRHSLHISLSRRQTYDCLYPEPTSFPAPLLFLPSARSLWPYPILLLLGLRTNQRLHFILWKDTDTKPHH